MQRLFLVLRWWTLAFGPAAFFATAFLMLSMAVTNCVGQYSSGNTGLGTTPMEPITTTGTSVTMPGTKPPTEPTSAVRPQSWPGAAPTSLGIRQISRDEMPPLDQLQSPSSSRCLALVGGEPVLESDIIGVVNRTLEEHKSEIPPDQIAMVREKLIRNNLTGYIQNKQIYLDARDSIPSEGWPSIEKQLSKGFDEQGLDQLMKQEKVQNRRELEKKLHTYGSSFEREKRIFMERELATQWVQQQIKRDEEITYDQMVVYYHKHLKEFNKPAKAKWEEIAVRISKYPTEAEAQNAMAALGNEVLLRGAELSDVAKRSSDGPTASSGGYWNWTSKGSLCSKDIDAALFSLPIGRLSPIIKDDTYFHIIRVVDREDAGTLPFLDAQVQIREKIMQERFQKQRDEYLAKIAKKIPTTTIYDNEAASAYAGQSPTGQSRAGQSPQNASPNGQSATQPAAPMQMTAIPRQSLQ